MIFFGVITDLTVRSTVYPYHNREIKLLITLLPFSVHGPQLQRRNALNASLSNPWKSASSQWRGYRVERKLTAAATWPCRYTFACLKRMLQAFSEGALRKTSVCSTVARVILGQVTERKTTLTTSARWVAAQGIYVPREMPPVARISQLARKKEHEADVMSFIPQGSLWQQASCC